MFITKCTFCCLISLFLYYGASGHHHKNHHMHHHSDKPLISTKELRKVSEELFDKLPNGILQSISINYQELRESKDAKDEAPEPLLTVPRDLFEMMPTVQLLRKLYDNYDINTLHAEDVTAEESLEEDDFIDSLLNTDIMMHSMDYLASKGYFPKNLTEYKKILKNIWFCPYAHSNHTEAGSSGFEHVFLVEKKRGNHVTGLHNWIFFANAEYDNKVNYLGYITKKELANKAIVIKLYLSYMEKTKLSSMFIGTPPEFEIALYTLCFYARPNKGCNVLLGNVKITIQTWVQYTSNGQLVAAAFPNLYN